ncbi:hypothetical protein [Humibacillus xanthopallidus]|uniref:hypothetical protein n=1 Tax=Humibacillus xanthopallidus TaxID=412689 RepID=UPI00384E6036
MLLGPPDASASEAPPTPRAPGGRAGWSGVDAVDAVLGLAVGVIEAARRAGDLPLIGGPVRAVAAVPGSVARAARAQPWVDGLVERGDRERRQALSLAHSLARRAAPGLVDALLDLVDVTELVRRHVDLDALAADLDVDAVVARADLQKAIDRVDLDGVVAGVDLQRIIDRIDVDAIIARANIQAVIDRVDVDAVVARADLQKAIDRVDLDGVVAGVDLQRVIDRIDVDAIVAGVDLQAVIDRVDVDAVVAKADLQAVIDRVDVDAVVARADLQKAIDRVDIDAVVARADFDAVIAKLDLIELAEFVVEGIDLPGIIRSSTGSMASEGLREVRRQGIGADERVAHVVDRLLHRQERAPGQPLPRLGDGQPAAPREHGQ